MKRIEDLKDYSYICLFIIFAIALLFLANRIFNLENEIEKAKLLNRQYKEDIINSCEWLGGQK